MSYDDLIAFLRAFLTDHPGLHPDCSLVNRIRETIEAAERYKAADAA